MKKSKELKALEHAQVLIEKKAKTEKQIVFSSALKIFVSLYQMSEIKKNKPSFAQGGVISEIQDVLITKKS
jgi:hypothetical protein